MTGIEPWSPRDGKRFSRLPSFDLSGTREGPNFILELRGDIALGRRKFVTERVSVYKSTRPN
jgi:hypothetical protein